jgi:hypothetical protein
MRRTGLRAQSLGLLCLLTLPAWGSGEAATPQRGAGPRPASHDTGAVPPCEGTNASTPAHLIGAAPPREARVYLDGSASMTGFAEQGSRFSALLASLRGALLDVGIVRSQLVRVGDRLEPIAHSGGFEDLDRRAFYSRGDTDLGAVLDNETRLAGSPSLAVLITDGVMSLRSGQGAVGSLVSCQRGSDVECLALKASGLVQSGRGLWIMGFRSAFHGMLYSERLRVGGGRLGVVRLPDRPLYVWVMSTHPASGRRLVSRLLQRMSERPDGEHAFVLEVAPGDVGWWLPVSDHAPESDNHLFHEGVTEGAVRGKFTSSPAGEPPTQAAVSQDLDGTGFGLRMPLLATPLTHLPAEITSLWSYTSSYCLRWAGRAPAGTLRAQALQEGDTLHFALFSPDFMALKGRRALVVQRMARTAGESDLLRRFVSWSTDDDRTVAAGSRTLNFHGFLESLIARLAPAETFEQPLLRIALE